MIGYYLSWLCGLIIITIPKSSHSSRFWSIIYLLIVIILRCIFTFTDIDITSFRLQSLFPSLTEYELIQYLHLTIPVIFLLFRIIAEYYYIDIETETIKYLMTISHNHRVSYYFI